MKNPYVPKKVRVLGVEKQTPDTKMITLDFRAGNVPGQFLELSLLNIGEAPISICSGSKEHTQLLVRAVGNVTNRLCSLNVGDSVFVRGPYGTGYPVETFDGDIAIIAGGTGTAPLRSVIQYIGQNRNKFGEVSLFLGFRSPQEVLFKKDIRKWGKLFNVDLSIDKPYRGWKENVGFIHTLVERSKFKKDTTALVCGPPIMMRAVVNVLTKKSFRDENIFVSYERLMHCGIGKCGHCMVNDKYVCRDGPVFNYTEAKHLED